MKRILLIMLVFVFTFIFVSCSNEKDTTSEADTSISIQKETESTDKTETTDSDTTDESSSDTQISGNTSSNPNNISSSSSSNSSNLSSSTNSNSSSKSSSSSSNSSNLSSSTNSNSSSKSSSLNSASTSVSSTGNDSSSSSSSVAVSSKESSISTTNGFKSIKSYDKTLAWSNYDSINIYDADSTDKYTEIDVAMHKPIPNMEILSKGTADIKAQFGVTEVYKILYESKEYFVESRDIVPEGETIETLDQKQFSVGQMIYEGKYHDIIVLANGSYSCSDGCNGCVEQDSIFLDDGFILSGYNEFCLYANACYVDPDTGTEYPLCTKPIYTGKYGTVYVLCNETFEKENDEGYKAGFFVRRNQPYRKVSLQDFPEESREVYKNLAGADGTFIWSNNTAKTFSDAKKQADSYEKVLGSIEYRSADKLEFTIE